MICRMISVRKTVRWKSFLGNNFHRRAGLFPVQFDDGTISHLAHITTGRRNFAQEGPSVMAERRGWLT